MDDLITRLRDDAKGERDSAEMWGRRASGSMGWGDAEGAWVAARAGAHRGRLALDLEAAAEALERLRTCLDPNASASLAWKVLASLEVLAVFARFHPDADIAASIDGERESIERMFNEVSQ